MPSEKYIYNHTQKLYSGDDVAFVYPDYKIGLKGTFKNNLMVCKANFNFGNSPINFNYYQ